MTEFRAGDLVEVRTEEEILNTLDERGTLDGLPFMPEMRDYCGKRFRVFRRADKTCDTIGDYKSRRMLNAVHLADLRCSGAAHGECQASCLLFWKEAWLRSKKDRHSAGVRDNQLVPSIRAHLTPSDLERCTHRSPLLEKTGEVYVCQATQLLSATTPLAWWDPLQYLRELQSGNVGIGRFLRTLLIAWYNALARRLMHLPYFWRVRQYPYVAGTGPVRTPTLTLNLQPGERVRIKSKPEILATLNPRQRNRGLWFDVEMVPFCGREFRVLSRIERIIDERSGRMIQLPRDCIALEGVCCSGLLSRDRLFCPRSIIPYWREIWLERVNDDAEPGSTPASHES